MLKQYLKNCQKCIDSKDDAEWCTFAEYCDIHLSNGSVFEDVVQQSCKIADVDSVEDIEMTFFHNQPDSEMRYIVLRAGDITAIVERHRRD